MTYLVHMRQPAKLFKSLGFSKFLGFQVVLDGMLLSALIHPIFYALLAINLIDGLAFEIGGSAVETIFVSIAAVNLLAGYLSAIALAGACATVRSRIWLVWHVLFMPLYWILISGAAYRALWQAVWTPYVWEKTPHRPRKRK